MVQPKFIGEEDILVYESGAGADLSPATHYMLEGSRTSTGPQFYLHLEPLPLEKPVLRWVLNETVRAVTTPSESVLWPAGQRMTAGLKATLIQGEDLDETVLPFQFLHEEGELPPEVTFDFRHDDVDGIGFQCPILGITEYDRAPFIPLGGSLGGVAPAWHQVYGQPFLDEDGYGFDIIWQDQVGGPLPIWFGPGIDAGPAFPPASFISIKSRLQAHAWSIGGQQVYLKQVPDFLLEAEIPVDVIVRE